MELSSKIKKTWKLLCIGSLLGSLILVLYIYQNGRNLNFLATKNAVQIISSTLSNPPVQEFTPNNGQSKEPVQLEEPMLVTPPVQEFISQGQSQVITMSKTPVQDVQLQNQASSHIISITRKSNTTLGQTPEMKDLKSIQSEQVETHVNIPMNSIENASNKSTGSKCNIFDGKWVYKPEEKPIYDLIKCPFIEEKFSCQKNGRSDNEYEKWSWKPNDCDIPMFSGREMVERLRNKRVIIVGDSMNRNMWESLSCLVYTSIPSSRVKVQAKPTSPRFLKAKDYNLTIEFYWSPFLVELNTKHKSGKNVLVLDRLSGNSKLWRRADVMVFNSGHWWTHRGKMKTWDLLEYKGKLLLESIPVEQAFEMGMKTWVTWIQNNVHLNKSIVFFRSISPQHKGHSHCYDVKTPINDNKFPYGNFPKTLLNVIESILKGMNKPQVIYLNVTKLSEYRKDAHPSVYHSSQGKNYATNDKRWIRSYADCNHWCLPGLPDTWNRLLFTTLFFKTT